MELVPEPVEFIDVHDFELIEDVHDWAVSTFGSVAHWMAVQRYNDKGLPLPIGVEWAPGVVRINLKEKEQV